MSEINSTGNPFLDSLRLPEEPKTPVPNNNKSLTQDDFFSLLSQQLAYQDPFKPVDNSQMIAQMSSFSTVDGIGKLNKEIGNLNSTMSSSQALQASSLVGRKVLIPTNQGQVSATTPELRGVVSTTSKVDTISVRIEDDKGQLVTTFEVDGSTGGNIDLNWDGKDRKGNPVPEGEYVLKASGVVDGKSQELPVSTYAHVSSVSLGTAQTGAILNLAGGNAIKLTDVLAVSET